ncbi:MAG: Crp/Fnr family transcriptional regulator [Pseudomarimonas sp.]
MTSACRPLSVNHLLAALSPLDFEQLLPHMEWVPLRAGTTLYQAGETLRHVYFPATAVIALVSTMRNGAATQVAVVGNEGVAGVCAFMGGRDALCSSVVLGAGSAWRISISAVVEHARSCEKLMHAVMGYVQALFTQIAQTSACNRHHAIEQQLCRWLLLNLDGLGGSEVRATQERIALLLGVRREGVTTGAGRLQRAGLIRYGRGRISVLDRKGLEQRSCESYAVIRQAKQRLLVKPGNGAHAALTAGAANIREVELAA